MFEEAGIHLLTGPPNSGKLGRVLEWWGALRDRGPLLLAPTRPDAEALAGEAAERFGPILGPVPAGTFDDLSRRILESKPAVLTPVGRDLLVRSLLSGYARGPLAGIASLPGTPRAVAALLRELGESGLRSPELMGALERWSTSDQGGLAQDVSSLYREYIEALARAGLEEPWQRIADAATGRGWEHPIGCYGFSSFTPGQRRLLISLSREIPVVISLLDSPGGEGDRLFTDEIAEWEGRARTWRRLSLGQYVFSSPEIESLNRRWLGLDSAALSKSPAAPEDPPDAERMRDGEAEGQAKGTERLSGSDAPSGVRLLVAAGRRNEVELVAEQIVQLFRRGFGPDDIAISAASLEPYRLLVSQVFSRAGIPHRIDGHVPLRRTGLGLALVGAVHGVAQGDRSSLFTYLRSPYAGVAGDEVDRLDLDLRRSRRLEGDTMLSAARRRLGAEIGEVEAVLGGDGAHPVDGAALVGLARGMLLRSLRAGGRDRLEEDASAVAAVEHTVAQIDEALDAGLLPSPPPLDDVLAVLSDYGVSRGREQQRGVVHVLPLRRVRARRFPALFLLGLVEGEFPAAAPEPPLMDALTRRRANEYAGAGLFEERRTGEDEDLFALALSRPWQVLYLSTRDAEEQGGEVYPSPFFSKVAAVLGGSDSVHARRGLDDVVHSPSAAPCLRDYVRGCVAEGLRAVDVAGSAGGGGLPPWRRAASITGHMLRKELAGREVFSPNELETYVGCPFRWFVQQIVRPEEIEREMDGRGYGLLSHGVLGDLYLALRTEGLLPLSAEGLERAYELLDQHLEVRLGRFSEWAEPGELRLVEAEARRHMRGLLSFDARSGSRFVPALTEQWVGRKGGVDVGGLRLSGRIDRVDLSPDGDWALVIDYKSGKYVPGLPLADNGALQVPLYMTALRAERPGLRLAGGIYAALASDTRAGITVEEAAGDLGRWAAKVRSEPEFEEELRAALERAHEAASGIRSAVVGADPPDGCPRFCDLAAVCRSGSRPARF